MNEKEALLSKVRSHKRNVAPKEIIDLLLSWGFQERKGKGSHRAFRHPAFPSRPQIIPTTQNPLLEGIVKQVLRSIQELQEQD